MFTPAGAKSRAARVTKRTRLETTNNQAAVPITQPQEDARDSTERVNEIQGFSEAGASVANAFNAVLTNRYGRSGSPHSDIDETDNSESQKTPSRTGPSLDQIEASLNRRGSLRSASKSIGRGSPSVISQRESNNLKREIQDISLEYDVTQSSLDRSNDEDRALLAQLDETSIPWDITNITQEDAQDFGSEDAGRVRTTLQRLLQPLYFWLCFMRRLFRVTIDCMSKSIETSADFWHNITKTVAFGRWILSLAILVLTIALPLLYVAMAQIHHPRSSQSGYVAPTISPANTAEIVSRLHEVEKSLESHYKFTQSLRDSAGMMQKDLSSVSVQGQALEKHYTENAIDMRHLKNNVNDFSETLKGLQDSDVRNTYSVSQLTTRLDAFQKEVRSQETSIRQLLQTGLEQSSLKMKLLHEEVQGQRSALDRLDAQKSQELARTKDSLRASILEVVEQSLPETLVISLKSGKAQSTAEFWRFFSEVFVTKADAVNGTSGIDQTATSPTNLSPSEAQLRTLIDGIYAAQRSESEQDGAVISRKFFLKLLHDELSPMIDDLQARVALLESFPSENSMQDDLKEKYTGTYTNSDLSTKVVQQLVNTAIHKYSLDILARPDYASYIAGARINPFLTSATYLHQPTAFMPRMISKILSIGSTWSHPPAVAIHASNAVGMCWAFPGSQGQLGVKLAKPIYLTDIAIEHVHPDIAHDATTAPREIEIWVHLASESADLDKLHSSDGEDDHIRRNPPAAGFVHTMNVIYNVYNKEQVVQLFPLPHSLRRRGVLVNQVVYRVKSNWGNEDFTCLYRVRAIGTSVTSNEAIEQDEDV